eukprot:c13897_g1_i1.p3 GENE.c13897_g1_i1~~c13897_g1_i1.p3  ORF type:complete len:111 (-),score=11.22 c13897_g1_i1:732-1043(-)
MKGSSDTESEPDGPVRRQTTGARELDLNQLAPEDPSAPTQPAEAPSLQGTEAGRGTWPSARRSSHSTTKSDSSDVTRSLAPDRDDEAAELSTRKGAFGSVLQA